MATLIHQATLNNTSDYPNTFVRTNAFPLERYSIFDTLTGAEKYATENPIAYIGQQIVVAPTDTATPSSFIISGGGNLVRVPDVYDLTSASDSLTADLSEHTSTSATTDTFGHVKLSNNAVLSNYGTIATNVSGQLVAPIATASSYGVVKIGENLGSTGYSVVPNCSAVNAAITSLSGTVNNKFLPLSGGTVTGSLTVQGTNDAVLKVSGISGIPNDSTENGSLFINYDNIDVPYNEYWTYDADSSRGVFICGSGNDSLAVRKKDLIAYSSSVSSALSSAVETKLSNEYLPLSGGTLSGSVYYGNDVENYSVNRPDLVLIQGSSDNNKSRLIFKEGGWNDQVHLFAEYADIGGADDNNKFHISTAVGAKGTELNATPTPRMTILFNSGNVGIGTTTPTEKLHVNGGIKSTALSSNNAKIYNTLSIGPIDINNGIINGISKLGFPNSIAIGLSANNTYADGSEIAIGQHSQTNNYSIAIGQYSVAEDNSINIGGSQIDGQDYIISSNSIGIGYGNVVSSNSVVLGNNSQSDSYGIVIGNESAATSSSIAIGYLSNANGSNNAVVIGKRANVIDGSAISIGVSSSAVLSSISIGENTKSNYGSIVIGTNITDTSSNVIHIEANGDKVFDGNHGHASLIINGFGLTITHQLSSESGFETEPSKVTITANTLDKLNHIDSFVTSGSVNLIQSGAVYDFIHGDTVSIGSTTNTPSGTIEIIAIENELQNKLAVSSNGLTLAHPVSSSNENNEIVYSQDEVTVTADELKRLKNIENLKSTMVVREWDYTSTLPETTMTNNTMMIFRNWDLEQNHLDLIDKKLETI